MYPFGRSPFVNAWDVTPLELFDQHFGMPMESMRLPYWQMPTRHGNEGSRGESGTSKVTNDKDKFEVRLDVRHFKPEELKVRTVGRQVTIDGTHEEQADEHGFISRRFTRKYLLPEDTDTEHVTSSLSHGGVLCITAPKVPLESIEDERHVPIEMATPEMPPQPRIQQKKRKPTQ
jgi:crystallin alpha B